MKQGLYREFQTQAELDAAYGIENSVPDFPEYARFYVEGSAEVRRSHECLPDVPFGPTRDEHLDIFPCGNPGAPTLIFIHGGYWRILSSKEFSVVAKAPVAAGYNVVVTNYSLCPKVSIDEITRQSRAAVAWVYRNIERVCGGDPERLFVAGHSAGGQQAVMTLLTDWEGEYGLPGNVIKAAVGISGLYDLRPLPYSFVQPALQLDGAMVFRNSPHLMEAPTLSAPLLLSYGEDEPPEFRRQTTDFHAKLVKDGIAAELLPQPAKNHFNAIDGLADAGSFLWIALHRFFTKHDRVSRSGQKSANSGRR